jgi:hypothetical protein
MHACLGSFKVVIACIRPNKYLTKWLSMPEIQSQIFLVREVLSWSTNEIVDRRGKKRAERKREYKRDPLMRILYHLDLFSSSFTFMTVDFCPKIYILKKKSKSHQRKQYFYYFYGLKQYFYYFIFLIKNKQSLLWSKIIFLGFFIFPKFLAR